MFFMFVRVINFVSDVSPGEISNDTNESMVFIQFRAIKCT